VAVRKLTNDQLPGDVKDMTLKKGLEAVNVELFTLADWTGLLILC
jgi:hypothetical protein